MVFYKIYPETPADWKYVRKYMKETVDKLDWLGIYMRIDLKETKECLIFEFAMRMDSKFPMVGKAMVNKYYHDVFNKMRKKFKNKARVVQCEILK